MGKVIGIIASGCPSGLMMGLTRERPIAALPFGGRYRLLDFPLSNMVNSGLRTVGIITHDHYRPVLDHLGAGKEWLLDRKSGGLFILPGYDKEAASRKFSLGDLAANVDFLAKDSSRQVIMSCSNLVINIDFSEVLNFHRDKQADVTLVFKEDTFPGDAAVEPLFLEVEADGSVKGIQPGPVEGKGKMFLDMLIIEKELLLQLIQKSNLLNEQELVAVIARRLGEIGVFAYGFSGYVGRITSLAGYFKCSMDLLKPEIRRELFMENNKIHTKITDNPPTIYGQKARVTNSLVASGCKIDGNVENSIIFRQVQVQPGAKVKNSIIMQKCTIGRDAFLENVILDKFVRIKEGSLLQGDPEQPVVFEKTADWAGTGGEWR